MTNYYIVTATFQHSDNLSKDRFVNRFYFAGGVGGDTVLEAQNAMGRVDKFFNTPGSGGISVGEFLSADLNRLVNVKVYDYAALTPRPILYENGFTLLAAGGSQSLPPEAAVCISYYSARNLPRQRGRLFIGPLCLLALAGTGGTVAPNFITALHDAGAALEATGDGVGVDHSWSFPPVPVITSAPVTWQQHSTIGAGTMPTKAHPLLPRAPLPELNLITAGWVDNEFDGQHRRRVLATSRTTF